MGEFGVDIFFVLSGFAVFFACAHALKNNIEISWKDFLLRRAARIFPAYQIQLIFIIILFCFGVYNTNLGTIDFIKYFFLLQNIPPSGSANIMGVYWTLPVEMNFYLSIPLLFYIIRRFGTAISLATGLIVCALYRYFIFSIYGDSETLWLYINQLLGKYDQFIFGIGTAIIFTNLDCSSRFYNFLKNNYLLGITLSLTGIMCSVYYFKFIGGEKAFYSGHISLFFFNSIIAANVAALIFFLCMQGK